jgi:DNA (cytosine-5)-methyltransferase 1
MRVLDLFSGIGGFSLGLERAGMKTVAFCEFDPFCQKVLAKHWPNVPCYPDVRELTKEQLDADGITADLICGGYPCQPFSTAGKRAGAGDDRHLWPEMYRLIRAIRPRWVLAENVAGHINMGLDNVLSDLEAANYAWWAFVIPACAVDAKHRRDRVWIVAHSEGERAMREPGNIRQEDGGSGRSLQGQSFGSGDVAHAELPQEERQQQHGGEILSNEKTIRPSCGGDALANAGSERLAEQLRAGFRSIQKTSSTLARGSVDGGAPAGWREWEPEPNVGRVANGVPMRVDRLKSLGNAVVPQVVEQIGRAIMEAA